MARRATEKIRGLSLRDFSDFDLLNIVHDVADNEGIALASDIVDRIVGSTANIAIKKKDAVRAVGSRFAWMRKFGMVEKVAVGQWRLTDDGEELIFSALTKSQENSLNNMSDTQHAQTVRVIAIEQRGHTTPAMYAARREWRRNMEKL